MRIEFQIKALTADKIIVQSKRILYIPATKEIIALVPDKNLLATIRKYPYFLSHCSGFFIDSSLINVNFGDFTILTPSVLPSLNIIAKPIVEPSVATKTKGIEPTTLSPTSVPVNTRTVSHGAGGNMFSSAVINKATISTQYHGTVERKLTIASSIIFHKTFISLKRVLN